VTRNQAKRNHRHVEIVLGNAPACAKARVFKKIAMRNGWFPFDDAFAFGFVPAVLCFLAPFCERLTSAG